MVCKKNSPHQHLRECIGNSMENMHTDVGVERVNFIIMLKNIITSVWDHLYHGHGKIILHNYHEGVQN